MKKVGDVDSFSFRWGFGVLGRSLPVGELDLRHDDKN